MHSSIVSKIEKARKYAGESDRVDITTLSGTFRGNHGLYQVSYEEGAWRCSCRFFESRELCSHTMALQRILQGMLPRETKVGTL